MGAAPGGRRATARGARERRDSERGSGLAARMGDKKDGFEDMGLEGSAFEALERDFQEVLQDLVGDKSLERFRVEYEKLHRALKKSHESEKRLIKKCRELNQEIVANAAKVQTALKLSQELSPVPAAELELRESFAAALDAVGT